MSEALKRAYLVGPVTSRSLFAAASTLLRARGYAVANVFEDALDQDPSPKGLRAQLNRAIDTALQADLLVLLPGWEQSPASRVQVITAASQGIPSSPLDVELAA